MNIRINLSFELCTIFKIGEDILPELTDNRSHISRTIDA